MDILSLIWVHLFGNHVLGEGIPHRSYLASSELKEVHILSIIWKSVGIVVMDLNFTYSFLCIAYHQFNYLEFINTSLWGYG